MKEFEIIRRVTITCKGSGRHDPNRLSWPRDTLKIGEGFIGAGSIENWRSKICNANKIDERRFKVEITQNNQPFISRIK